MTDKTNQRDANDLWFPPYTGIKKAIFNWGQNNGYTFVDSEINDLIEAMQPTPQSDTLDEKGLEAARKAYDDCFDAVYITHDGMNAAIRAYLAATKGSV